MQSDFGFQATTVETRTVRREAAMPLPPGWISPGVRKMAWTVALVYGALASWQAVVLAMSSIDGSQGDWMGLALHAAMLAVLPLLVAARACSLLRRRGRALQDGQVDATTGLYNRAGLVVHGNALRAACVRDKRAMAVAVFDFKDLLEMRGIYGQAIYRLAMARVARKMRAVAGARGLAVRTGAAQFTLLMPGAGQEKAQRAVDRVLGSPARIEFDAGRNEIVLVPEVMIDNACVGTETVEELYVEMSADLARMQKSEERRVDHARRRRERHSRPMGLHALAGKGTGYVPAMPRTITAPLSAS